MDNELKFDIKKPNNIPIHMPKKTAEVYFQFSSLISGHGHPPIKICDIQDNGKFIIEMDTKKREFNIPQNITFRDDVSKMTMEIFVKHFE